MINISFFLDMITDTIDVIIMIVEGIMMINMTEREMMIDVIGITNEIDPVRNDRLITLLQSHHHQEKVETIESIWMIGRRSPKLMKLQNHSISLL